MKHTASMILKQRMEDEQQNAELAAMTIGAGCWPEKVKGTAGERSSKVTSGAGLPG